MSRALDDVIGRRELLRAFGASAAVAALAPLACGGRGRVGAVEPGAASASELRAALRDAVTVLGDRLDRPRAWVLVRRRVRALADVSRTEVVDEERTIAVLSGHGRDGERLERCFDDVTPARVRAIAAELASAAAGPRREVAAAIPAPVDHGAPVEADPARLAPAEWLTRVRALARRGEAAASSRIVYRAAWLVTDDDRVWVVGEDGDRHQRLVRSRVGTTFVAWHGSRPQHGEAEVAGGFGPAVERLDDEAIARAAALALALFTPAPPAAGAHVVLLDPAVVAALVDAHARGPTRAAPVAPAVAVVDDPTVAGYARLWFDDDGAPATVVPVVGGAAGAAGAAVAAGPRRRGGPAWRLAAAPAHLVVAPGTATAVELEAGIHDGLVLEGVRDLAVDDAGVALVRVGRGRQLQSGVRTGRQWGELEVRGAIATILADATAASREQVELAVGGDGPPRAVTAPWLLTRAHVSPGGGWT